MELIGIALLLKSKIFNALIWLSDDFRNLWKILSTGIHQNYIIANIWNELIILGAQLN